MFSNPLGQLFGKSDKSDASGAADDKKKKRNKKSKRVSPGVSEENLSGSRPDLSTQENAPSTSACAGLIGIVNEISGETDTQEKTEIVEVKYEELPIEPSTLQSIVESIQNLKKSK